MKASPVHSLWSAYRDARRGDTPAIHALRHVKQERARRALLEPFSNYPPGLLGLDAAWGWRGSSLMPLRVERWTVAATGNLELRVYLCGELAVTMRRLSRSKNKLRLWYIVDPSGRVTVRRGVKNAFSFARRLLDNTAAKAFANAT